MKPNTRKTTLARNYAMLIGIATLPLKRVAIIAVRSYDARFQRRVETYIWEYVRDQHYAALARN